MVSNVTGCWEGCIWWKGQELELTMVTAVGHTLEKGTRELWVVDLDL